MTLLYSIGSDSNCGNPLSKDYLTKMQSGILINVFTGYCRTENTTVKYNGIVLEECAEKDRVSHTHLYCPLCTCFSNQFIVWDSDDNGCGQSSGVIIPLTMVAGTVTRRAVESTWLTASNAKV